jgi:hypothetical protein
MRPWFILGQRFVDIHPFRHIPLPYHSLLLGLIMVCPSQDRLYVVHVIMVKQQPMKVHQHHVHHVQLVDMHPTQDNRYGMNELFFFLFFCLLIHGIDWEMFASLVHSDPCPSGYYSESPGRGQCSPCPIGRAAAAPGAVACDECVAGTVQNVTGQTNCTSCEAGKYNNGVGSNQCQLCLAGTYNPTLGLNIPCPSCAAGTYAASAGSIACTDCPSGKISTIPGATTCIPCDAGSYSDPETRSSCLDCALGKFANSSGTPTCSECKPGYYQGDTGRSVCAACQPGSFSTGGADKCEACTGNAVAPNTGSSTCATCVAGIPSEGNTICVCPVGQYFILNSEGKGECVTCPSGAYCAEQGLIQSDVGPEAGYWRETNTSLVFYRCLLVSHCPDNGNDECGAHRTGPLCAVCESNTRTTSTGECSPCSDTKSGSRVQISFIIIAILLALILMYYLVLRSDHALVTRVELEDVHRIHYERSLKNFIDGIKEKADDHEPSGTRKKRKSKASKKPLTTSSSDAIASVPTIAASSTEMTSITASTTTTTAAATGDANVPSDPVSDTAVAISDQKEATEDNIDDSDYESGDELEVDEDPHSAESDSLDFRPIGKPNLTYKLKIILGFFQIGTNITFALDIPWPNLFKTFVQLFNVSNLYPSVLVHVVNMLIGLYMMIGIQS